MSGKPLKSLEDSKKRAASLKEIVKNGKYSRGGGLGFEAARKLGLYSDEELEAITALEGTDGDVTKRMPVKITDHYVSKALRSTHITNLVKARPEETADLSGQADPSSQLSYSPVEGLLHKYEMALMYVVTTCSAHCRYCYRLDLLSGREIERADGTVAKKKTVNPDEVAEYIRKHNEAVAENDGAHPETGRPALTEVLLSGGDPMVLNNKQLAYHMAMLAESGVTDIRIGTKELAFFPQRFDKTFFNMLDTFHNTYQDVKMSFAVHFTHPDEFLRINNSDAPVSKDTGRYERTGNGDQLKWNLRTYEAVQELAKRRSWINMANQTPIIDSVNDDPVALSLLQEEMVRNGIENHYFFQNREIEGHRAFAVPVEKTWEIFNESQKGLSGLKTHAKLAMSTVHGKMEVVGVFKPETVDDDRKLSAFIKKLGGDPQDSPLQHGFVVFKILRSPGDAKTRGDLIIAGRNEDALWLTGYKDRIVFDGPGIQEKMKKPDRQLHLSEEMEDMYENPDKYVGGDNAQRSIVLSEEIRNFLPEQDRGKTA